MGRRALPKLDPALDLSGHLTSLDNLSAPLDFTAWCPAGTSVEIEVGTGKGLFLRSASSARPDHFFLGCEIAGKYARFAASRLAREGRDNALLIHGDGLRLFREFLAEQSAAAVHVYFPDPWWKKRHRRRRVMTADFVVDIQRVLRPGGRLHFWTDVQEYFEETLQLIHEVTNLVGPYPVEPRPAEHDLDYRTHFERRMRIGGCDVFRSEFERTSDVSG